MATTDTSRAMAKVQRRTHAKLAVELGHQPTLRLLAKGEPSEAVKLIHEARKVRVSRTVPEGFTEWKLADAFADAVRDVGRARAVEIIASELVRLS